MKRRKGWMKKRFAGGSRSAAIYWKPGSVFEIIRDSEMNYYVSGPVTWMRLKPRSLVVAIGVVERLEKAERDRPQITAAELGRIFAIPEQYLKHVVQSTGKGY